MGNVEFEKKYIKKFLESGVASARHFYIGAYREFYEVTLEHIILKMRKIRDYHLMTYNATGMDQIGYFFEALSSNGWSYLGQGTWNYVFVNQDKTRVLKISVADDNNLDAPERSVRLWNQINPAFNSARVIPITSAFCAWECPYIEGVSANDEEIADCLVDIFSQTDGRIIMDPHQDNFIKTKEGRIVCIDIGMALQFEPNRRNRSYSYTTDAEWDGNYLRAYRAWMHRINGLPRTIAVLKALYLVKNAFPRYKNVDFIKQYQSLLHFERAFDCVFSDHDDTPITLSESMHIQLVKFTLELEKLKVEIVAFLNEFSNVTQKQWLKPRSFKNQQAACHSLIQKIQKAKRFCKIQTLLKGASDATKMYKTYGIWRSPFAYTLAKCLDHFDPSVPSSHHEINSTLLGK